MSSHQSLLRQAYSPVDEIVSLFKETFNRLAKQQDLSPANPAVNELLTQYVNAVIEADRDIVNKDAVLNNPDVKRMMKTALSILSRAEFEMEKHFAGLFEAIGPMPLIKLNSFWYRANYRALVDLEMSGVEAFSSASITDNRPIAFIGSGPLPLSAIDYYLRTGKSCTCIELDQGAAAQSAQLIKNLGLDDVIVTHNADGRHVDYKNFSMIFVAALVDNKDEVLDRVRATANNAIIGIRSADGLKQMLYTKVDVKNVERKGFLHAGTTLGTDYAVNSTCFFKLT